MRVFLQIGLGASLVFSVSPLLPWSQSAGTPRDAAPRTTGAPLLRQFEERYRTAGRLQATFLERYSENGRLVRMEAGTAYFLRPGKMRWDYEAPESNTFLVDGKYVWFYSPADRTATRMPVKSSEDWRTPFAFLTTGMKLSRICSKVGQLHDAKLARPEDAMFRCVLRGSENVSDGSSKEGIPNKTADQGSGQKQNAGRDSAPESSGSSSQSSQPVLFELSPQGELVRLVVHDQAGIEIEFSFRNWQWNPTLSKSLFQFTPPRGVAIVNGPVSGLP